MKKMKYTAGVILALILMVVISCQLESDIKIGFSGSISGRNSTLGLGVKDGVVLAVDTINEEGGVNGRELELIIKDDENSPEKAREVDRELIEEGVVAIIGHVTSAMSQAALPVVNQENMLLLSPTTSSKRVTGMKDNLISAHPPNDRQQEMLADYLLKETDIRTVSVIYDTSNDPFSSYWLEFFSSRYEGKGGRILSTVSYDSKVIDEVIMKKTKRLLEKDPDAVLIISSAIDTATICQQIDKQGGDVRKLSSGWAKDETLLHLGGKAVESILIPGPFREKTETYQSFQERIMERYGRKPGFAETFGYETMLVLYEAMLAVEEIEPMALKEEILSDRQFKGLRDSIVFNEYGEVVDTIQLFTVRDNQFERIVNQ